MQINDEENNSIAELNKKLEKIHEGANYFLRTTAEALKPLSYLYNTDVFDNLSHTFKIFSDGVVLYRLQSLGDLGWCNIDKWINNPYDKNISFSSRVIMRFNEDKTYDVNKIDKYIGRHFSKDIIKSIEENTIPLLDYNDSEKLKKAMVGFRARRYLESANLLASLIDAQNIKQELYDIAHNKYSIENCDKNNRPNVSQGWRAFYIVFCNNFSIYFDGEKIKGKTSTARKDGFNNFVQNIKGKLPSDENIIAVVALSCCLLKFFEDSDFRHYPDYIPAIINRHWLMHGMYDLQNITRYDCIKLLLILNQISIIYSKLKNGEL